MAENDGINIIVQGNCIICEKPTTLRCQPCLKNEYKEDVPFYCGKDHQAKHWKKGHKSECGRNYGGWLAKVGPCEANENVVDGCTYYVAKEDLEPGRILFERKLLLGFPLKPGKSDIQNYINTMPSFALAKINQANETIVWTCVGCYEIILYGEIIQKAPEGMQLHKCNDCGWPLHSTVNPKQPPSICQLAHEDECKILVANGLTWENVKTEPNVYYCLGLLRACLLSPPAMEEFMKLPVFSPYYYSLDLKSTIPFIRKRCGLADKFTEEKLNQMLLIIIGNILGPLLNYTCTRTKLAYLICSGGPTGRVLPHDCTPNCVAAIGRDMKIKFKTIRIVDKDQPLSINYISFEPLTKPLNERIKCISQMLMDPCHCPRCSSSTENGTYLSAIKCPANRRQCEYLLPIPQSTDSPTLEDLFVWKCSSTTCPGAIKQNTVDELVLKIRNKIEAAADNPTAYTILKCLAIRYAGRTVHPNHAVIVYARINIAAVAGSIIKRLQQYREPDFNFDHHKTFLVDFTTALEILKSVQPGQMEQYGVFLFIQSLLKMSALAEKMRSADTKPSLEDLNKELGMILWNVNESWTVLNGNPLAEPFDLSREDALLKIYSNHLQENISREFGEDAENLESFKLLKKKFCGVVHYEMSQTEKQYRQCIMIPPKELPKLIKHFETIDISE